MKFKNSFAFLNLTLKKSKVWCSVLILLLVTIALLYWFGIRRPRSIQAFINASVISIQSPIAGNLKLESKLQIGKMLKQGEQIGVVSAKVEDARMSQLRIREQELLTRIIDLEARIGGNCKLSQEKQDQLAQYELESKQQKKLQIEYGKALKKSALLQYLKAVKIADLMKREAERSRQLQSNEIISLSSLEKAITAEQTTADAAVAQKAIVDQSELMLKAYTNGLQLDGSRSLSEPDSRIRELNHDIVELDQQSKNLVRNLESTRTELSSIQHELAYLRNAALTSPMAGVVWSIVGPTGQNVDQNDVVIEIISLDNIWVEAFFHEADLSKTKVNSSVYIRDLKGQIWNGKIETIRSGTGRVSVGQCVVDPPPEISHRQLPVRVSTARIRVDWSETLKPERLYSAGESVEVFLY